MFKKVLIPVLLTVCMCVFTACAGSTEAMKGVEKEIEVTLKEQCETCNGTGAKPGSKVETCTQCGGKGQVAYTRQSLFGMTQSIQACPQCRGTGKIIKEKCSACLGNGYISRKKKP